LKLVGLGLRENLLVNESLKNREVRLSVGPFKVDLSERHLSRSHIHAQGLILSLRRSGHLVHHGSMAEPKFKSERLRREAEELRQTAQRLIEEAAWLLAKSTALEKRVSENERRKK
jgi:hypothetical protein